MMRPPTVKPAPGRKTSSAPSLPAASGLSAKGKGKAGAAPVGSALHRTAASLPVAKPASPPLLRVTSEVALLPPSTQTPPTKRALPPRSPVLSTNSPGDGSPNPNTWLTVEEQSTTTVFLVPPSGPALGGGGGGGGGGLMRSRKMMSENNLAMIARQAEEEDQLPFQAQRASAAPRQVGDPLTASATANHAPGRISVYARLRPEIPQDRLVVPSQELNGPPPPDFISADISAKYIQLRRAMTEDAKQYHYDGVFGPDSTQEQVYESVAKPLVGEVLQVRYFFFFFFFFFFFIKF